MTGIKEKTLLELYSHNTKFIILISKIFVLDPKNFCLMTPVISNKVRQ